MPLSRYFALDFSDAIVFVYSPVSFFVPGKREQFNNYVIKLLVTAVIARSKTKGNEIILFCSACELQ